MFEEYIEYRFERSRNKAAALSELLRYLDVDAMPEEAAVRALFRGLAEICWDIAVELGAIKDDLFPEKAEVLQDKSQGNHANQQEVETNSQQVSSERG